MGNATTVSAVAFAGAIGTIIAWAAEAAGTPMPPYVAAAITTAIVIAIGWFVPAGRSKP